MQPVYLHMLRPRHADCHGRTVTGEIKMKISTKGRYALRFMLDLAVRDSDSYVPLKEISARQEISLKYLEQIVSQFGKAGLIDSVRGPQGGYRLSRRPDKYTVGEIIRCVEGSLAPVACLEPGADACPRRAECGTVAFWEGLQGVIDDYVDSVTLQDLADRQGDAGWDDYCI